MRGVAACGIWLLALALAACNAPRAMTDAPAAGSAPSTTLPAPVPPAKAVAPSAPPDAPLAPDRSCRTDADCAVKDVGNCCGRMPACVNAKAAVDPAATQAWCARQGIASTCGFVEVTACQCVASQCTAAGGVLQ